MVLALLGWCFKLSALHLPWTGFDLKIALPHFNNIATFPLTCQPYSFPKVLPRTWKDGKRAEDEVDDQHEGGGGQLAQGGSQRCASGLPPIISVNMRHNSSHYSTQLTTNVTLHKTKQSLHISTQSFEAKPYLKIFSLFQELERRGPLSGLGFFTIERSTITGMLSTAVTYIIILVQFRMSTN